MGALQSTSPQVVALPAGCTSNAGTTTYTWWIKGTLRNTPAGVMGHYGTSSASTSNGFVTNATLQLRVYTAGTNRYGTGDNFFEVGVYHHYRLEHDSGGAWRAYKDDMVTPVASGTFTTSTSFVSLNQLFRSSSSSSMYSEWDLEEMGITSTSFNETYNADLSGGTGNILPTISGNNQGALNTPLWPSDDSQWIGFGATYTLTADGASWEYSGASASLLFGRQISAEGTSWQYQGGSASTLYGRSMQADGAAWSYAGGVATLTYTGGAVAYVMVADGASLEYSGADAGLLASRRMVADGSSWQYQSAAASLLLHRKVSADGSSWQYSFAPATLLADRRLSASGTSYAYSGGAASLNYSGAVTLQINGYTVSYSESAVSAAFGASPVAATYIENLRAEYGNV